MICNFLYLIYKKNIHIYIFFTFLENFILSSPNKIHFGCPQSNKEIGFKLKSVLINQSEGAKSEEIINNLHSQLSNILWS